MLHSLGPGLAALVASLGLLGIPTSTDGTEPLTGSAGPSVGVLAAAPASPRVPTTGAAARACGPEPSTAAGWQAMFDGLDGEWSGGDGSSSSRLPDGRLLWLFGDTVVGNVSAAGVRLPGTRLVRNSVVVTDGDCADVMSTAHEAFASTGDTWLWPTDAVVTTRRPGGTTDIVVFAQRMRRTGLGAFDFERVATAVVSMRVPWDGVPVVAPSADLAVAAGVDASSVLWGAAVLADGPVTWIYGTRDSHTPLVFGRDLLLARSSTATTGDSATWDYRTAGSGWSDDAAEAGVVRSGRLGVSTVPSAARIGTTYAFVTKPQEFLDDRVVLLKSDRPWGPWTSTVVARSRSTATAPTYSPAFVAPEGLSGRRAVVVVNRTTTNLADMMADATRSKPIFVDVLLR